MDEVFAITPAGLRTSALLAAIGLLFLAIALALAWLAWSARHSRVEVRADSIRLVGDLWGRSIPIDALDLEHARPLDLDREPGRRPLRRRLGTALPGYASGWFRLADGEKALVYLTDRSRVAYVPTTEGYALLLSVPSPESFLERLARHRSR